VNKVRLFSLRLPLSYPVSLFVSLYSGKLAQEEDMEDQGGSSSTPGHHKVDEEGYTTFTWEVSPKDFVIAPRVVIGVSDISCAGSRALLSMVPSSALSCK